MSGRRREGGIDTGRLIAARRAAGLTQQQLGVRVGVVRQTIAAWERGTRAPEVAQLARLAAALGVPLTFLLAQDGDGTTGVRWNVCALQGMRREG